jgi:hypothetical protein
MSDDSAGGPAAPGAVTEDDADAGTGPPRLLLDVQRRLRERERGYLAGVLHDGPIQELAAALLQLAEARRAMGASQGDELGVAAQLVETAGRSLRGLQDELWPFPRPSSGLAATLRRRTSWLLAAPLVVDAGAGAAELLEAEIQVVADLVESILACLGGTEAPARALAAVRADQDLIFLEMNMTSASDGDLAFGDPAAARASLHSVAAAIRARADIDLHGRRLRARMEISRRS